MRTAQSTISPSASSACQSRVESNLCLARRASLVDRGEVEEAEVDGALDLEHLALAEEDPRDVGFDQLEAARLQVGLQRSHDG